MASSAPSREMPSRAQAGLSLPSLQLQQRKRPSPSLELSKRGLILSERSVSHSGARTTTTSSTSPLNAGSAGGGPGGTGTGVAAGTPGGGGGGAGPPKGGAALAMTRAQSSQGCRSSGRGPKPAAGALHWLYSEAEASEGRSQAWIDTLPGPERGLRMALRLPVGKLGSGLGGGVAGSGGGLSPCSPTFSAAPIVQPAISCSSFGTSSRDFREHAERRQDYVDEVDRHCSLLSLCLSEDAPILLAGKKRLARVRSMQIQVEEISPEERSPTDTATDQISPGSRSMATTARLDRWRPWAPELPEEPVSTATGDADGAGSGVSGSRGIRALLATGMMRQGFRHLELHARGVPKARASCISSLAAYLVQGEETAEERAWVIFCWIAGHIAFSPAGPSSPEGALRSLCASPLGFAELFGQLCSAVGVVAAVVPGQLRTCGPSGAAATASQGPGQSPVMAGTTPTFSGSMVSPVGSSVGFGSLSTSSPSAAAGANTKGRAHLAKPHHWSRVQFEDGSWHLVDCALAASVRADISGEITDVIMLRAHYFGAVPGQLVFTHCPRDSQWQQLGAGSALAPQQFTSQPLMCSDAFFAHRLCHWPAYRPSGHVKLDTSNTGCVQLRVPAGVEITAALDGMPSCCFQERSTEKRLACLTVLVEGARNLALGVGTAHVATYCTLQMKGRKGMLVTSDSDSLDPDWNASLEVDDVCIEDVMTFTVYRRGVEGAPDSFLGISMLPVAGILGLRNSSRELALDDAGAKLQVSFSLQPAKQAPPPQEGEQDVVKLYFRTPKGPSRHELEVGVRHMESDRRFMRACIFEVAAPRHPADLAEHRFPEVDMTAFRAFELRFPELLPAGQLVPAGEHKEVVVELIAPLWAQFDADIDGDRSAAVQRDAGERLLIRASGARDGARLRVLARRAGEEEYVHVVTYTVVAPPHV